MRLVVPMETGSGWHSAWLGADDQLLNRSADPRPARHDCRWVASWQQPLLIRHCCYASNGNPYEISSDRNRHNCAADIRSGILWFQFKHLRLDACRLDSRTGRPCADGHHEKAPAKEAGRPRGVVGCTTACGGGLVLRGRKECIRGPGATQGRWIAQQSVLGPEQQGLTLDSLTRQPRSLSTACARLPARPLGGHRAGCRACEGWEKCTYPSTPAPGRTQALCFLPLERESPMTFVAPREA